MEVFVGGVKYVDNKGEYPSAQLLAALELGAHVGAVEKKEIGRYKCFCGAMHPEGVRCPHRYRLPGVK